MIINSIVGELKANGDMSMDYLSHNVSENLKRIRQSKGMSLDQVAEQTGVSKSMLAQIEKGTANPSIGVLGKITSGLRIEFQRLIDPPRVDYALISPDDLVPTKELLGQYRVWTCFPYEDSREVEVYRIDVEPGGVYTSGGHGEKTREYLTVTDGVTTMCRKSIGDRCISLRPISLICIAMMERGWQAACASFWIILIFGEIFVGYPIAYIGLPIYNDVH